MAKAKVDKTMVVLVEIVKAVATACESVEIDFNAVLEEAGVAVEADEDEEGEEPDDDEESDEEEMDVKAFVADLEDEDEVKSIAKELEIETKKKKLADIKKAIAKKDEEEIRTALEALGYFESDEEGEEPDDDEDDADGEEEGEEEAVDVEDILDNAELDDLKAVAKSLKIKGADKMKKKAELKKAIMEKDDDAVIEALTEAGLIGDITEEEVTDFVNDMQLAEIKKLAEHLEVALDKKKDKTVEAISARIFDAHDFNEVYTALDELGLLEGEDE